MAKLQGRRNRNTSFGKRQDADDAFRKKKKEGGSSYGRSDKGDERAPRGERRGSGGGFGRRERSEGGSRPYGRSNRSEGGERRGFGRGDRKDSRGSYGKPDRSDENAPRGERRGFDRKEGGGFRGSRYEGGARKFSTGHRDDRGDSRSDSKRPFGRSAGKPYKSDRSSDDKERDDKKPFRGRSDRSEGKFSRGKSFGAGRGDKKSRDRDKPERRSFVESKVDDQRRRATESIREEGSTPKAEPQGDGLIRLNKFISNSGVCSRREADELIKMGVITVNGTTITEMGYKVKPTDDVRHDGKRLTAEKPVYILLNKPKGFITTTDDPQERNTVMELVAGACKERVYPVGRLDRNTTGLLLLTNDGDLTDKLTHPSFNAKKIYKVELDKPLTKADFQRIVDGVKLEEGTAMVDDLAIVSDDNKTVGIELHIGWNHVVRRIFNALEYDVVKLDRVVYAGLDKKDLKRGQWRFLKNEEIVRLKHFK